MRHAVWACASLRTAHASWIGCRCIYDALGAHPVLAPFEGKRKLQLVALASSPLASVGLARRTETGPRRMQAFLTEILVVEAIPLVHFPSLLLTFFAAVLRATAPSAPVRVDGFVARRTFAFNHKQRRSDACCCGTPLGRRRVEGLERHDSTVRPVCLGSTLRRTVLHVICSGDADVGRARFAWATQAWRKFFTLRYCTVVNLLYDAATLYSLHHIPGDSQT
jgi:hypothetical protein